MNEDNNPFSYLSAKKLDSKIFKCKPQSKEFYVIITTEELFLDHTF